MAHAMSEITRFGRYLSWTVADQIIGLGVPRLVLFPILGAWLGKDAFGAFGIALSLTQMIGLSPSNGLMGYLIRDYSRESEARQALMVRTTLVLTALVVLPFTLFFVFGAGLISHAYDNHPTLIRLLPFLGLHLLFTNVGETALTVYRIRRAFGFVALIHAVQALLLFLALPLFYVQGDSSVATAYLIAGAAALAVQLRMDRASLLTRPFYAPRFAQAALRVWPAFSLSALISLSAGYLDRLLLGYWWSAADVAPFFAAVSTASMAAVPATLVSNLILSLLGKVRGDQGLSRGFHRRYFLGACASSVVVYVVGSLLGKPLLGILYPTYIDDALPLWNYAVGGFAVINLSQLFRPFVSKFLSPAILPMLSGASLTGRLIPLLLLVPSSGRLGAAQALLIGSTVTGLLWLVIYLKYFVFTTAVQVAPIVENAEPIDAG